MSPEIKYQKAHNVRVSLFKSTKQASSFMIYKETLSSRHKKCKKLKRSAMPFRAKAHVDMHALVWSVMMALVGGVRTLVGLAGALVPPPRRTWWLGQRRALTR